MDNRICYPRAAVPERRKPFQLPARCTRRAAGGARLESCLSAHTFIVTPDPCSETGPFVHQPFSSFDQTCLPRVICTRLKCGQLTQRCAFFLSLFFFLGRNCQEFIADVRDRMTVDVPPWRLTITRPTRSVFLNLTSLVSSVNYFKNCGINTLCCSAFEKE